MFALVQAWLDICLFRARPQDLPASLPVLFTGLLAYLLSNVFLSLITDSLSRAVAISLLDLVVLYLFVRIALLVRGKPERLLQTLSAVTGSGAVLGFVALPVISAGPPDGAGNAADPMVVLWLAVVVWSIAVFAHILRHALSIVLPAGVFAAILYIYVSYTLMQLFFPTSL